MARADVVVDGRTIAAQVPVTYLLFDDSTDSRRTEPVLVGASRW